MVACGFHGNTLAVGQVMVIIPHNSVGYKCEGINTSHCYNLQIPWSCIYHCNAFRVKLKWCRSTCCHKQLIYSFQKHRLQWYTRVASTYLAHQIGKTINTTIDLVHQAHMKAADTSIYWFCTSDRKTADIPKDPVQQTDMKAADTAIDLVQRKETIDTTIDLYTRKL